MLEITHNSTRMTQKRKDLMTAAIFHACRLGISEINAEIRINFKKKMSKKEGFMGNCGPEKGRIVLNLDADLPLYLSHHTLAHEMVHAKQWLTGQLSYNKKGNGFLWNGAKVSKKLAYHETPWEVEAMQNEIIMAHSFTHFLSKL